MLKKFLVVMGVVIFTVLVAVAGLAGFGALAGAPKNKAIAEAVTRDLARSSNAIEHKPPPLCTTAVPIALNFANLQMSMNKLKPLGALKKIEQADQTAFHYSKELGQEAVKTATVEMVAEFENGLAKVIVQLKSEGG